MQLQELKRACAFAQANSAESATARVDTASHRPRPLRSGCGLGLGHATCAGSEGWGLRCTRARRERCGEEALAAARDPCLTRRTVCHSTLGTRSR
eukprot:6175777-Pleurochrysis_carterae.AAC.2